MRNQKTKTARQIKEETVKSLAEKIKRAKTMAFADYHGLTVNQIADLRRKIKEAGGELIVTKNTLLSRALESSDLRSTILDLTGPTATVFAYEDEISPIKTIADFAKTLNVPKFKFGFFDQSFLDAAGLESLAKIPSMPALQAQFVGALASPIYGFVNVLQANIRNLVSVLDQAAKSGARP